MDDLNIAPPAVPGTTQKKKKGFFSRVFKRDAGKTIDDVRMTEEHLSPDPLAPKGEQFNLEDIRRKAGIEGAPDATDIDSLESAAAPVTPAEAATESDATESNNAVTDSASIAAATHSFDAPPEPTGLEAPAPIESGEQLPSFDIDAPEFTEASEPDLNEVDERDSTPVFAEANEEPVEQSVGKWANESADSHAGSGSSWIDAPAEQAPETDGDDAGPWSNISHESDTPSHESDAPEGVETPAPLEIKGYDHRAELDELDALHKEIMEQHEEKGDEMTALPVDEITTATETVEAKKEAPPHHKQIEKVFDRLAKKHEKLDKQLENIMDQKAFEVPEWKYQKKEIPPDKYFKLKNGQDVKNFKDLMEALSFVTDETFNHHVTEDRNDFADWVEHILGEEKLAEQIRNKKAREELLDILHKHEEKVLKDLQKQIKLIEKELEKKHKNVKKVRDAEARLKKLETEFKTKSNELAEFKKRQGELVKKKVNEHVEAEMAKARKKLAEDRKAFDDDRAEFEQGQLELESRAAALDEKEESVLEREAKLADMSKVLDDKQAEYKIERTRMAEEFEQHKHNAKELIAQADAVEKTRADAEKMKAETKALIVENKKAEKLAVSAQKRSEKELKKLIKAQEKFQKESDEVKKLKKELQNKEKSITAREKALEKDRESIDPQLKKIEEDRKALKETSKRELAVLAEKRKDIETMTKELQKKMNSEEKLIKKNDEILKEIEKKRKEILKREKEIEKRGFSNYLAGKVDETVAGEFTDDIIPKVEEVSNVKLYRLIDKCKEQLDKNDLASAKRTYNTLRGEFSKSKLSSHEKSLMYNAIRELYDDIHLAILNN